MTLEGTLWASLADDLDPDVVKYYPYISVKTEDEIPEAVAKLKAIGQTYCKLYVGFSPDDWDERA